MIIDDARLEDLIARHRARRVAVIDCGEVSLFWVDEHDDHVEDISWPAEYGNYVTGRRLERDGFEVIYT